MRTSISSIEPQPDMVRDTLHVTMLPVRRTLPWNVRQRNLAHRRAERLRLASLAGVANPSFGRARMGELDAECFFDVRQLEANPGEEFGPDTQSDDDDADWF